MVPLRPQVLLALAALLALAPLASAEPLVEAETQVQAEVHVAPPGAPMSISDALAQQALEAEDAERVRHAEEEAARVDGLVAPLARFDAEARARAEADADLESTSRSPDAATKAGAEAAAGVVVDFVRNLPEPVKEAAPPALAAAGFMALLQAFGGFRALGLGGVALYSRLSKSELLDNGHRDNVYKLIQETPGASMSEIGERTGLGWGTVVYHLDRLEKAGFVASERVGMHRCYFPVGTVPRASREGIGALKTETTRSIAVYLVNSPGASQSQMCETLGLSPSAASKQISKLEKAGLVRREREWKTVHLFPGETLPGLLGMPGEAGADPTTAGTPAQPVVC